MLIMTTCTYIRRLRHPIQQSRNNWAFSSLGRARHLHCRGTGIETLNVQYLFAAALCFLHPCCILFWFIVLNTTHCSKDERYRMCAVMGCGHHNPTTSSHMSYCVCILQPRTSARQVPSRPFQPRPECVYNYLHAYTARLRGCTRGPVRPGDRVPGILTVSHTRWHSSTL